MIFCFLINFLSFGKKGGVFRCCSDFRFLCVYFSVRVLLTNHVRDFIYINIIHIPMLVMVEIICCFFFCFCGFLDFLILYIFVFFLLIISMKYADLYLISFFVCYPFFFFLLLLLVFAFTMRFCLRNIGILLSPRCLLRLQILIFLFYYFCSTFSFTFTTTTLNVTTTFCVTTNR